MKWRSIDTCPLYLKVLITDGHGNVDVSYKMLDPTGDGYCFACQRDPDSDWSPFSEPTGWKPLES